MATQTKIALFGVGRWGINLLRNLLAQPQVQIVAIADLHSERLTTAAKQLGLNDRTLLSTDWQLAMDAPGIDAVVIATPAATHYTLITAALKRGYHVLAEKPLTLEVAEAFEVCQLAQRQQCQLVVDHTYLFHPAVERGKALIQSGAVGDLQYGYAARTHLGPVRHDVDALWDLAVHDLNIFNTWLGQYPYQVEARGAGWLDANSPHFDQAWLTLTYPTGFQATIHLCWANPDKQRRLTLVGNRAALIFDELQTNAPLTLQHGRLQPYNRHFQPVDQRTEVIDIPIAEPLSIVCQHFLSCIQQGIPSTISSGWVGADLVQILSALNESLQQGGQPIQVNHRSQGLLA